MRLNHHIFAILAFATTASADTMADQPSLDWMTGHWCMEDGVNTTEEIWLPPVGGVLVGLGRSHTSDRTTGFEFLRIVEENGVQTYLAQPGGKPPTRFTRTEWGTDWVRFENPDHDFPQRVEYRLQDQALRATASSPGRDGGETMLEFDYRPCSSGLPASDDIGAIEALRTASNQAIARHDVDAFAAFLAPDYVITISTGAIEHSREAALNSFAAHFAEFPDVVYVRTPIEITLSEAYPLAIENGTWVGTRTDRNGPLENGGKYTAGWQKVDGVWKIHSELFVGLYCRGADC